MSVRRLLFGLVLGASLATNGYLLHARGRQRARTGDAPPADRAVQRDMSAPTTGAQSKSGARQGSGMLDRAALEARVRDAEARVEALLPMSEKFDRAAGGPEDEARVRAALDPMFGVEGSAQRPYELECRGDICRFTTDRPPREWQEAIQTQVGLARDMSFSSDGAVYFHVEVPGRAAGMQYVMDIANALEASPAFAACKRGETQTGTVIVHLQLVGRRVEVGASGPLAASTVGTCIRRVVEDIVRATSVPEQLTSLPFNDLPVPVP